MCLWILSLNSTNRHSLACCNKSSWCLPPCQFLPDIQYSLLIPMLSIQSHNNRWSIEFYIKYSKLLSSTHFLSNKHNFFPYSNKKMVMLWGKRIMVRNVSLSFNQSSNQSLWNVRGKKSLTTAWKGCHKPL